MYRHILVPTDGSPLSLKAARTAARLARTQNARITAVYSVAPFTPPATAEAYLVNPDIISADAYQAQMKRQADAALAKVEAEVRKAGVPCDSECVTAAAPWEGIVKAARAGRCDLIVMATHARTGLPKLLLGSETVNVLTHTKTPVLVCR